MTPLYSNWIRFSIVVVIVIFTSERAAAAEVFTKGKGLDGSVVGVNAQGVEFQTIYGKGTILIQWSDVESILSDKEFLVLTFTAGLLILYRLSTARSLRKA